MTRQFASIVYLLLALTLASASHAAGLAALDQPAPLFTLTDASGKEHSLADYHGSFVVLEWVNYDCPFVHKHYSSGNMQKLQKKYGGKGVVWLSICSSARGRQGYFEGKELTNRIALEKAVPAAYLIDQEGKVGTQYGARTTPHMFVVDPKGILIYAGGIDNIPSTDIDDIPKATNYVQEVLDAAMAGSTVITKASRSYGCSVKYN